MMATARSIAVPVGDDRELLDLTTGVTASTQWL